MDFVPVFGLFGLRCDSSAHSDDVVPLPSMVGQLYECSDWVWHRSRWTGGVACEEFPGAYFGGGSSIAVRGLVASPELKLEAFDDVPDDFELPEGSVKKGKKRLDAVYGTVKRMFCVI